MLRLPVHLWAMKTESDFPQNVCFQNASWAHRKALLTAHGLALHPPPPAIDPERRAVRSAANALAKHFEGNPSLLADHFAALDDGAALRVADGKGVDGTGTKPERQGSSSVKEERGCVQGAGTTTSSESAKDAKKKKRKGGIPAHRVDELLEVCFQTSKPS